MLRLAIIFIILNLNFCFGQKSTFYFHIDKISIKEKTVKDSTNFNRYQENALQQFKLNGYTGIQLKDSVIKNNGTHYYYSYTKKFDKIILNRSASKRRHQKTTRTKDYLSVLRAINKEIISLENNGYPFAKIKFTKQEEKKSILSLTYEIDSGDFFFIDKIHIKSQSKFHDKTIFNLIGINVGDKYDESEIVAIETLLLTSTLYKITRPVEVLFRKGKAELYIFIEKEKSSTADGYIGFQQDQMTNKLVLNGYINLQLNNSLNRAEIIDMNWKSNPDKTQNLKAKLEYPFLFNSPLGIGGAIDLRKQDSTFLRTDITLNLSYYHPYARFKIFDQIESSSTLRNTAPAEYRDYSKNTIGASAHFIAPKINALSFYHPQLFLMGGIYNYRNDTIDDNKQKISNSKFEVGYKHSIDFLKYFHLNNSLVYKGLTSNITLSQNEMIYFGGLRSVRGFYELELSAKDAWMLLNEIEFRPIDLLSIFLLYDYSSYHGNGYHQTNSFGFGFSLNSKSNAIEIIVANGVLDQNPFDLTNTKIHIGFKSSF
jgi:hypothetical protein